MSRNERAGGLQAHSVTDPGELELARQLNARLDLVEPLLAKWSRVAAVRIRPGSQIALDDEHSAWRHLSHTVTGALNLAADNLRAFRELVRPGDKLVFPQFAHYPLLRASLEGASLALWIVGPEDPKSRVQRLLRAAAAELDDENTLSLQMIRGMANDPDKPLSNSKIDMARKQHKQRHRKHAEQIRSVAEKLGIQNSAAGAWAVSYAEIVREATAATGIKGYYGETMWRMISGLSHPSLMRAVSKSNVEEVADNGDGTLHALITTDLGLTRTAFEASYLNLSAAIEVFGARKIRPADRHAYSPSPE